MKAKHYLIAATALTGIIFVSANLLVQNVFTGARIDFTENNLYTLSDATKTTSSRRARPWARWLPCWAASSSGRGPDRTTGGGVGV